jgi:TPR repeat protein
MNSMITLVSYLVLAVSVATAQASSPASGSGPFQQGTAKPVLINPSGTPSRNSPAKIAALQAKAEAGDASAQAELGKAYQDGNGVPQNDALALKWLRKAADQGDASAENGLGVMYRMGQGVPRDMDEAFRWYQKAAKQGDPKARFNLGASYYNGDGVAIDDVASLAWFELAHEAGNPAADEALRRAASEREAAPSAAFAKIGQMYESGEDLPKNVVEALKWYRKAADDGDAQSAVRVTSLLLAAGRNPTAEEYAEARQRCEDAAKQSFPPGAFCMALIYRRGIGTAKDPVESQKWLARAADLGHPRAAFELGEAYWKGVDVKPDLVAAYMWIWLAYNAKEPGAEQDEQQLGKELSAKQVSEAKKKAIEWAQKRRLMGLQQHHSDSAPPLH